MATAESIARRIFIKDRRLRPALRALIYILATIGAVATLVTGIRIALLLAFRGHVPKVSFLGMGIGELLLATGAVGVAVVLRRFLDRRSIPALGFPLRGRWLRLVAIGAGVGAGMKLLVFATDQALGYSRVTGVAAVPSVLASLPIFLVFFVIAALAEEMSMRGYLFQNLWEEWGFVPALVITSLLFAGLHLGNPHSRAQLALTLAGLIAYGALASLSLLWSKSLWVALGAHFGWNFLEGPVLGFPVSGASFGKPLIAQAIHGPAWFTGGSFGPEAGADVAIALVVGLGALYVLYRRGAFASAPDYREPYAR